LQVIDERAPLVYAHAEAPLGQATQTLPLTAYPELQVEAVVVVVLPVANAHVKVFDPQARQAVGFDAALAT